MASDAEAPTTDAATRQRPYHWFKGKSVRELYDRLTAAGPDEARLEVRVDAHNGMKLRVRDGGGEVAKLGGEDCPDINESRLCPPIC